jgi:hypothetical protein
MAIGIATTSNQDNITVELIAARTDSLALLQQLVNLEHILDAHSEYARNPHSER